MRKLIYIFILFGFTVNGQVMIDRQVIGSTGGYVEGGSISLSSTVGETTIQTFAVNQILTQGFQQPNLNIDSLVSYEVNNESCDGANNGSITVTNVLGCSPQVSGSYSLIIKSVVDSSIRINSKLIRSL